MTIANGGEYEWFGGSGAWRERLPPTSLSSEFKIIDQIFGQTHRKKRAQEQTMETMHNWVSLTCRCRSKPWRLLTPRILVAPPCPPWPLSLLRSPIFGNACGLAGMPERRNAGRNGDECQCIKFIQWLLQLFFFHDEALWVKAGLAWQKTEWRPCGARGGAGKGRADK